MLRAKFSVGGIDSYPSGTPDKVIETVRLNAVYSADPESQNYSWSKWTPSGVVQMTITNPDAQGKFEVGKEYYLDITPA